MNKLIDRLAELDRMETADPVALTTSICEAFRDVAAGVREDDVPVALGVYASSRARELIDALRQKNTTGQFFTTEQLGLMDEAMDDIRLAVKESRG